MTYYLRQNIQLLLIVLVWVISAFALGTVAGLVVVLTLLLLLRSGNIDDAMLGFLIILVMSDSLFPQMAFAKSFKNAGIVLLAAYAITNFKASLVAIRLHVYFLPFFIAAAIGIAFSPVTAVAVQKLLSYILLTIIVPYFMYTSIREYGYDFLRKMVWTLLAICVLGFAFNFLNPEVSISHGGRFRGVFGNPNGQGIFLIMFTLFFGVVKSLRDDLFTKRESLFVYVSILFFIFLTGSRTALLSFLLFFLFSFLFKRSAFLGFIVFGIVILLTEYFISNFISIIMALGLESEFRVETLTEGSGRLIAWDFAWQDIKRSLILGRGMGYDEFLMRSNAETLMQLGHEGGVHNTYLIIWLNTGLIDLIAFVGAFIALFIRASLRNHLAFPVMITVFFSIMFEPWLASSLNPYTIILFSTVVLFFVDYTSILSPVEREITQTEETHEALI